MAATRGRHWFAAAYLRTLVALTWRILLALFVADIGRQTIFDLFHLYLRIAPPAWRTTLSPAFLNSSGPLLACIVSTLWFELPFAAVRYGLRDRFVQLTFAIAVGATVAFLFIPWTSLIVAAATLLLAIVAFTSTTWRKPLEVLAWSCATGLLMIGASDAVRLRILVLFAQDHRMLAGNAYALLFQSSLLALAFVCSRLHTLLLGKSPSDSTLA